MRGVFVNNLMGIEFVEMKKQALAESASLVLTPEGMLKWEVDPFESNSPCYSACNSNDEVDGAHQRYQALRQVAPDHFDKLYTALRDVARKFFITNRIGCGSWDA